MSGTMSETQRFLQNYKAERLPQLVPGVFSGALDLPDFTVDQRYIPPQKPVAA
jgi:hypothetical protein